MMDAVYMVRPGPVEELRYSLRSLAANVTHDRVWMFGAAPGWVARGPEQVTLVSRPKGSSKYATTTGHLRAMCTHPEVSDPFVLWMDDVYAVRPVGEVPLLHLGPLDARLRRFEGLRSAWAQGMRATAEVLADMYPQRAAAGELLSYEAHAPLVVHKAAMLEALDVAARIRVAAPHKRTLYGNIVRAVAGLDGVALTQDPKWVALSATPPSGEWLSSDDASFRVLTKPILRWLFPDPCVYELPRAAVAGAPRPGVVRPGAAERLAARREMLAARRARATQQQAGQQAGQQGGRMRPVPSSVAPAERAREQPGS